MIWDQIKSCWWDQVVILTFFIWALYYRETPDAVLANVTTLHDEDKNAGANNVMKNVLAAGEQMRRTWEEQ